MKYNVTYMNSLKDKFENYAVQPDSKVWENINTTLLQHRSRRRWLFTSSAAAVGVGAVALLFALNNDKNNPSTVSKGVTVAQNNTEIVASQDAGANYVDVKDDAPVQTVDAVSAENSEVSPIAATTQPVVTDAQNDVAVEASRREDVQQVVSARSQQPSAPVMPIVSSSAQTVVEPSDAQPVATTAKANSQPVQESPVVQKITTGTNSKVPTAELAVWIPNAFSPDDPVEESARTFKVFPNNDANIRTFEIFIYSRTGRLVYHSKDYTQGWDGTANGQPQPMGTYVYIIELNDVNKGLQHTKGTITLLR